MLDVTAMVFLAESRERVERRRDTTSSSMKGNHMRGAIIPAVSLLAAISAWAAGVPLEPDAAVSTIDDPRIIPELAQMVLAAGYRCDTISHARPFVFSSGYELQCNHYHYDIEDKGGHWTVTVK
jgi:hypothetical protein